MASPVAVGRNKLRRSPLAFLIGAVVFAAGLLGAWWMWASSSNDTEVVSVSVGIERGQLITAEDLSTVRIGLDQALRAVPGSDLQTLVGKRGRPTCSRAPGPAGRGDRLPAAAQGHVGGGGADRRGARSDSPDPRRRHGPPGTDPVDRRRPHPLAAERSRPRSSTSPSTTRPRSWTCWSRPTRPANSRPWRRQDGSRWCWTRGPGERR